MCQRLRQYSHQPQMLQCQTRQTLLAQIQMLWVRFCCSVPHFTHSAADPVLLIVIVVLVSICVIGTLCLVALAVHKRRQSSPQTNSSTEMTQTSESSAYAAAMDTMSSARESSAYDDIDVLQPQANAATIGTESELGRVDNTYADIDAIQQQVDGHYLANFGGDANDNDNEQYLKVDDVL